MTTSVDDLTELVTRYDYEVPRLIPVEEIRNALQRQYEGDQSRFEDYG